MALVLNGRLELWEVDTGRRLFQVKGSNEEIWIAALSPDGSLLASGSIQGGIRLWDVNDAKEPRKLRGHPGAVTALGFSSDGRALFSRGEDNTVRIWDLQRLEEVGRLWGPSYSRFFSSGEAEANSAELSHLQAAMDAMLAYNRINVIDPQPEPTSEFSALPAGDGAEFLSPAFLRSSRTKCTCIWEADGFLIQSSCTGAAS